jgi:hypothetical protein
MLAHTIYGVDFSGAARAGDNIYLARGRVPTASSDETLHIETCTPAPTLLDTTADRDAVLSGLREFIATRPTSDTGSVAFGCDFAFSIPMVHIAAVDDVTDWQSFLQWFPGDMTDPSTFASWAGDIAAATETKRTYIQRLTDTRVGALSPYHFLSNHKRSMESEMCSHHSSKPIVSVSDQCNLQRRIFPGLSKRIPQRRLTDLGFQMMGIIDKR